DRQVRGDARVRPRRLLTGVDRPRKRRVRLPVSVRLRERRRARVRDAVGTGKLAEERVEAPVLLIDDDEVVDARHRRGGARRGRARGDGEDDGDHDGEAASGHGSQYRMRATSGTAFTDLRLV